VFLKNYWYAAALPGELGERPLARTICGEPVVLFRTEGGTFAALADRCAHRAAPLSLGTVRGESIECGYHGLRFGPGGACVKIPGQDSAGAAGPAVRAYPLVQRWNWLWIWLGDPALANPDTIPALSWFDNAAWTPFQLYFHVQANWQLFSDNLLDLSHVSFTHAKSIGSPEVSEIPLKTWVEGDRVFNRREMRGVTPGPFVADWGGFTGRIDRISSTEWSPPANLAIEARFADASNEIVVMVVNPITPETETSTHLWMGWARNFRLDDAAFTARARQENEQVLHEDIVVIEGQQSRLGADSAFRPYSIKADAGLVQARRIVARLLQAEASNAA